MQGFLLFLFFSLIRPSSLPSPQVLENNFICCWCQACLCSWCCGASLGDPWAQGRECSTEDGRMDGGRELGMAAAAGEQGKHWDLLRQAKEEEGSTYSCKLCSSSMCMRSPIFQNPSDPLQSPHWAGTGGEILGKICCWAVEGHPGAPKVSCPLAQPGGPGPWLCGQPLPSADETWKCQIQTKQPQICRVPSRAGYQGSGHGIWLRSAWRGCSPPCTSHPGVVLWYLAFIPLCLISSHLELVKTIPCKQIIQQT